MGSAQFQDSNLPAVFQQITHCLLLLGSEAGAYPFEDERAIQVGHGHHLRQVAVAAFR